MNIWAIIVAAVAAFVASAIYYVVFAKQRAKLSPAAKAETGKPPAWQMILEIVRNLVLAFVLAYLVKESGIDGEGKAAVLSLLLWVGFPVILLSGSIMYEKVPAKLAAIHSGDWLIKLFLMTAIIGNWR